MHTSIDLREESSAGETESTTHAETDDGHLPRAGGLEILHGTLDVLMWPTAVAGRSAGTKPRASIGGGGRDAHPNSSGPVEAAHQMPSVLIVDGHLTAVPNPQPPPQFFFALLERAHRARPTHTHARRGGGERTDRARAHGSHGQQRAWPHRLSVGGGGEGGGGRGEARTNGGGVVVGRSSHTQGGGPYLMIDAPPLLNHDDADAKVI